MSKNIDLRIYLAKNLGDDIFLKIIAERYNKVIFHVCPTLSYERDYYPKNVRMHDSNKEIALNRFLHKIKIYHFDTTSRISRMSDLSVIIGGSIFQQHATWKYTRRSLEMFHSLKKCYYIIGCNFGPFDSRCFFRQHKRVIQKAVDVCFRDKKSYNLFSDLSNVRLAADVAFLLDVSKYKKIKETKKVVISVIDLSWRSNLAHYLESYERFLINTICHYSDNGYDVELMSFSKFEGDEKAIRRVLSKLGHGYHNNITTYFYRGNLNEALNEIKTCEIMIASRFHANVLGFIFGKKVLPIIYSEKTANLLSDIDYSGPYIEIEKIPGLLNDGLDYSKIKKAPNVDKMIKSANKQFYGLDSALAEYNDGQK